MPVRRLAGSGANLGCPDGVTPPDTDGDSIPDLLDGCPQQAGLTDLGGCPDRDGDGVPDSYDTCPDQPGQSDLFGCAPVTTVTLPAASSAITTANAGSIREAGRLVAGIPRFGIAAGGNLLALRSSDDLLTYDLSAGTLAPAIAVNTGWSGYPVAVSSDSRYLATLEFPPDFSTPPFVQIRDGATGAPVYRIESQAADTGLALGISVFAFDPVLPLLAIGETSGGGFTGGVSTPLLLWDVANNRSAGTLTNPDIVTNLAFSGDGTKLATDSAEGDHMIVTLWDVGAQTQIASFETTAITHFMGTPLALNRDGSQIAVGAPDGTFNLWQISGGSADAAVQCARLRRCRQRSRLGGQPQPGWISGCGGGWRALQRRLDRQRALPDLLARCRHRRDARPPRRSRQLDPRHGVQRRRQHFDQRRRQFDQILARALTRARPFS